MISNEQNQQFMMMIIAQGLSVTIGMLVINFTSKPPFISFIPPCFFCTTFPSVDNNQLYFFC